MKKSVRVLISLLLFVVSVSGVSARQETTMVASIAKAKVLINEPFVCLTFDLQVDAQPGSQIAVFTSAYYADTGDLILNMSGDPLYTSSDGFVMEQYIYDLPYESNLWAASDENPMVGCISTNHFPLNNTPYSFHVFTTVMDAASGEVLAGIDSAEFSEPFVYEVPAQLVRITNLMYDFEAVLNGEEGMSVFFTFEALGYQGQSLEVTWMPVALETNTYLDTAVPNSPFSRDGIVASSDTVPIEFEYVIWADWFEGARSFSLFTPYSIYPVGTYVVYPHISVSLGGGQVIYDYVGGVRDEVELSITSGVRMSGTQSLARGVENLFYPHRVVTQAPSQN